MGTPLQRNIGLARALSKLGFCSRSSATELIREARVRLNGKLQCDPEAPVHLEQDRIEVDGTPVKARRKMYLMMNKPRGLVTTASDEKGRRTIYSILNNSQANLPWLAPVGRLDKASEGLILLTNDSEWGARVAAPETHLEKTYHVQIAILATQDLVETIIGGVPAEHGEMLRALRCRILRSGEKNSWLEIVLDEGKNRQIRRMLAAFDIEVLRLIRVAIGPLELGNLAKGAYRSLTVKEKRTMDRALQGNARR